MPQHIQLTRTDAVTTITFDRAAVRNALNYEMAEETAAALADCNADPACRAVVLTGAGEKAFCAGMDIKVVQTLDAASAPDWMARMRAFYEAIRGLDKPCVAAVNGTAAGAGYQIALLADYRVGHAGVRMGQTEIKLGLASILGAHIMYPHLGHSRSVELTLSGRLMDGEECHRVGLFHELVPEAEVRAAGEAAAARLAALPPVAMRLSKQNFREMTQAGFDAAFAAAERLQSEAYASGEPQRMMAAFLEARSRRT